MIKLFLGSLLISTSLWATETCELQKFNIKKSLQLEDSVQAQISKLQEMGNLLHEKKLLQEKDLSIINDVNHENWLTVYDSFQQKLKKDFFGTKPEYLALDEQGIMLKYRTPEKIEVTISTQKMQTNEDFKTLKSKVISVTVGKTSYASIDDFASSKLPDICLQKLTKKTFKDPLLGDIHHYLPSENCD